MTKEHGTLTSVHSAWIASNTDPGAVGAHKVWRDTSVTPNVYRERNDADTAWDDLGSFSTGASPWLRVAFPFTFNTVGLDTGVVVPGWTPAVGDVLYDAWISIVTAFDGITPQADVRLDGASPGDFSIFHQNTSGSVDLTLVDPVAAGLAYGGQSSVGLNCSLQNYSGGGTRHVPAAVAAPGALRLTASRDGTPTGSQASVTADAPPTSPLSVVAGVNDEFVFTPAPGGIPGAPETFTVAPGTYTGVGAIAAAMAGALGGSAEQFQTLIDLTDDGSKIILTGKQWALDNSSTITLGGNDVAAALGFTANPDFLLSGEGGPTGATQGAAVLHLLVLPA